MFQLDIELDLNLDLFLPQEMGLGRDLYFIFLQDKVLHYIITALYQGHDKYISLLGVTGYKLNF